MKRLMGNRPFDDKKRKKIRGRCTYGKTNSSAGEDSSIRVSLASRCLPQRLPKTHWKTLIGGSPKTYPSETVGLWLFAFP